MKSIVARH